MCACGPPGRHVASACLCVCLCVGGCIECVRAGVHGCRDVYPSKCVCVTRRKGLENKPAAPDVFFPIFICLRRFSTSPICPDEFCVLRFFKTSFGSSIHSPRCEKVICVCMWVLGGPCVSAPSNLITFDACLGVLMQAWPL